MFYISTHAPAGGATRAVRLRPDHDQHFYSRPCGRGDRFCEEYLKSGNAFLLTPLREGRPGSPEPVLPLHHFYSRPCGRGDGCAPRPGGVLDEISTHAPAGGATQLGKEAAQFLGGISTHAPAGGATGNQPLSHWHFLYFYSRPCGRGDVTPEEKGYGPYTISTHAPAGGATSTRRISSPSCSFLLTPLREGRPGRAGAGRWEADFYSRPCGRGDEHRYQRHRQGRRFLLTPLREGRPPYGIGFLGRRHISTHAPAGGATTP